MVILLSSLIVLIIIAGLLMLYHLIMYYRTSSNKSIRGYKVEKHHSMVVSRGVILAILIAIYTILLAFTKK